jgi:RecA/RadA recombinase
MADLEALRAMLDARGPPTPTHDFGRLSGGCPEVDDALGGGYLRGGISELVGPPGCGGTALTLAAAARVTAGGELVAWLDPGAAFDPVRAEATGLELTRVLWVRPRHAAQALEVADMLLESGGFPLMVLDLAGEPDPRLRLAPAAWPRLAGRLREEPTALLVRSPHSLVGALARTTLTLRSEPLPGGDAPLATRRVLVEVQRNRGGPVGDAARVELDLTPVA